MREPAPAGITPAGQTKIQQAHRQVIYVKTLHDFGETVSPELAADAKTALLNAAREIEADLGRRGHGLPSDWRREDGSGHLDRVKDVDLTKECPSWLLGFVGEAFDLRLRIDRRRLVDEVEA